MSGMYDYGFGPCDIFGVYCPINLDTLNSWDLVAEGIISADRDDEVPKEHLECNDDVSASFYLFKMCIR